MEALRAQLLDDRRPCRGACGTGAYGYGPRGGSVGSAPCCAADVVEALGAIVVRRERLVIDRPGRRDAVDVLDRLEVLAAQPVEHAAPELRVAADAVVRVRRELAGRDRPASARARGSAGASRPPRDPSSPLPAARNRPARESESARAVSESACAMVPPPAPVPMMMMS